MSKEHISKFLKRIEDNDFKLLDAVYENPVNGQEEPIFKNMTIKDNHVNFMVIYGDNASGKSLFIRILNQIYSKNKEVAVRSSSMANRARGGIESTMIFGDQSEESTGKVSVKAMILGIDSMKKESERESIFIADEPEIGLSPAYSKALAEYLIKSANEINNDKQSIVIATHNKYLVKNIIEQYGNVSYLGVNTSATIEEWLEEDKEYSLADLLMLPKIGINKWRGIINSTKS